MSHYEALGVGKDATPDEITAAYRRAAQRAHPDKNPDDKEAGAKFHPIVRAYKVLRNPADRAWYDKHGEEPEVENKRAAALRDLAALMSMVVDAAADVEHQDLLKMARDAVKKAIAEITQAKVTQHKAIMKRRKVLKRLTRKGGGDDVVSQMLLHDINRRERDMVRAQQEIDHNLLILEVLVDYQYEVEPAVTRTTTIDVRATGSYKYGFPGYDE